LEKLIAVSWGSAAGGGSVLLFGNRNPAAVLAVARASPSGGRDLFPDGGGGGGAGLLGKGVTSTPPPRQEKAGFSEGEGRRLARFPPEGGYFGGFGGGSKGTEVRGAPQRVEKERDLAKRNSSKGFKDNTQRLLRPPLGP
jgi:hypothetical protein